MGNLKTGTKILAGFALAVAIAVTIGIVGYTGIKQVGAQLKETSEDRLPSIAALGDIISGQLNTGYAIRGLINRRYFQNAELRKVQFEQIDAGLKQIQKGLDVYLPLPQDDEEKRLWGQYMPLLEQWRKHITEEIGSIARDKERILQTAVAEAEAQGLTGDAATQAATDNEKVVSADSRLYEAAGDVRKLMRESQPLLQQIIDLNKSLAAAAGKKGDETIASSSLLMFGVLGFGALVMFILGFFLSRAVGNALKILTSEAEKLTHSATAGQLAARADAKLVTEEFRPILAGFNDCLDAVIGPLNMSAEYMDRISKGDIPPKITDKYNGDFNEIKNNLNMCIDAVNALVADANLLSKSAVEGKLAARADASKHQGDFRKVIQGVDDCLDAIIGPLNMSAEYMDRISKGDIPPKITDKYNGDFNEIKNNINQCIDALTFLKQDLMGTVNGQKAGETDHMCSPEKLQGFYSEIAAGINEALGSLVQAMRDAIERMTEYSKGDFTHEMRALPGRQMRLTNGVNTVRTNVLALIDETDLLVKSALDGKLDVRADASTYQGDFHKIIDGFNKTLDAVIGPLNMSAEYMDRISKGDIPPKITDKYNGDFNEIKNNLNQCIDALNMLQQDFVNTIDGQKAGDIERKCSPEKLQGVYSTLAKGINEVLDASNLPVLDALGILDKYAQGDFTEEMRALPGKRIMLTNCMNTVRKNILSVIADINQLVKSASEGDLTFRADASKHGGDFSKIIAGVNDTLDSVITPINEASTVLEQFAHFDLRPRMKGNYRGDHEKIKTSVNQTGEALHAALIQVADAVDQISSASGQIASSSQQVAEGASEQASSLEETSSSLEEMSSMTKQNAENTQQTKALTDATKSVADRGANSMSNMVEAMGKIRSSAENTAEIIKDINEVAFQTNLLALNAAVEAARAGDAGRGFAVVAEEVRNLAGRAKDAAKKTEELIKQSVQLSESGAEISKAVNGDLNEIVTSVGKVADIVSEITVASQEQSRGIDQVNKAVAEMDKVVQQAAANSEESSSAAEELAGQAQELAAMVSKFQLNRTVTHRTAQKTTRKVAFNNPGAKTGKGNGHVHPGGWNIDPEAIIPMADDPDFASF